MINKLSVMVADIDGTLCPKGENLMPKTRAAIQSFTEKEYSSVPLPAVLLTTGHWKKQMNGDSASRLILPSE